MAEKLSSFHARYDPNLIVRAVSGQDIHRLTTTNQFRTRSRKLSDLTL